MVVAQNLLKLAFNSKLSTCGCPLALWCEFLTTGRDVDIYLDN